jgi:hypothetical protein
MIPQVKKKEGKDEIVWRRGREGGLSFRRAHPSFQLLTIQDRANNTSRVARR